MNQKQKTLIHSEKRALVVFSGTAEILWLRLLKPGFRHCFVVIGDKQGWVFFNPLVHRTELEWIEGYDKDDCNVLASFYRRLGFTVLETELLNPPRRVAQPSLHSCVEAVKRVLGLDAFWVLTPWQLYKYLKNN